MGINVKTAVRLLKNNRAEFFEGTFKELNKRGCLRWLSDKAFLHVAYWARFGEKLNLKDPQTFNEKLQWLKLYDRRPDYIQIVDKIAVKNYIEKCIGKDYVIPTLGVWSYPDDIDWDKLPSQFVIKWNHDSGSIVICKDKEKFNSEAAIDKLRRGARVNGFWYGREWPYKGVTPLLLAEPYLEDTSTAELRDYKVFCFNGIAKLMLVASDRQKKGESVKFDYFDMNGNHLDIVNNHPQASTPPELPQSFKIMIELAEKISMGYPHLRVDFYEVDGKVYFGELTLYHGSGLMSFTPDIWNYRMGEWIDINSIKRKTNVAK